MQIVGFPMWRLKYRCSFRSDHGHSFAIYVWPEFMCNKVFVMLCQRKRKQQCNLQVLEVYHHSMVLGYFEAKKSLADCVLAVSITACRSCAFGPQR